MNDTVFIGYGGGLVAMMRGGKVWGAPTPEELIAKLDAEGIDRKRLYLIVPDDLCCPDHALNPRIVAEFVAILGEGVQRGA